VIDDLPAAHDHEIAELQHHRLALGRAQEDVVVDAELDARRAVQHLLVRAAAEERVVVQAGGRDWVRHPVAAVEEEVRARLVPPIEYAREPIELGSRALAPAFKTGVAMKARTCGARVSRSKSVGFTSAEPTERSSTACRPRRADRSGCRRRST
jgi:hypothetical protein